MSKFQSLRLLGPAFVAAVAYVDPGNVAANMTSGSLFGFMLVWVLVMANAMAALIQYQSAKLGLVTGKTLPEQVAARTRRPGRLAYWLQAEAVIIATDIAEVVGGAVALHLLFGLPLWLGGLITGGVSLLVLLLRDRWGYRAFQAVVMAMLGVVAVGFMAALVVDPPAARDVASGLVPRLAGSESVLIAASMLGATVMPHAIYLHSDLALRRHAGDRGPARLPGLLRVTKVDVVIALLVAGAVNIGMLVTAADHLRGVEGTDTLEGVHAAIGQVFGPVVAVVFAVGLLASGLASSTVGAYAGDVVMGGLLGWRIPPWVRRAVSLVPAMLLLLSGADPTQALVISQVVLSFGIPFALIPLARFTGSAEIMGVHRDRAVLRWAAGVSVVLIVALNVTLLVLTFAGQ